MTAAPEIPLGVGAGFKPAPTNPPQSFLAKARTAWGEALPDWVEELAREADRTKLSGAGKKIGYSSGAISAVLANKYRGDLARVEAKVRGALMGATVLCPVLGEIGRDRCLDEQKMPNTGASSLRSKLYRACRAGCPHSRLGAPSGR